MALVGEAEEAEQSERLSILITMLGCLLLGTFKVVSSD